MSKCPPRPPQPPVYMEEVEEEEWSECAVCGRVVPDDEQGTFCRRCKCEVCADCWETGCCDNSLATNIRRELLEEDNE